jgi:hypothetical protein
MPNWVNVCIDWFSLPALALLAGILLYRKLHKEFPLFFSYIVATELVGLARLAASSAPTKVYSYTYWISDVVLVAFAFLATYELFIKRLFPGFYRIRFFRYLFPAVAFAVTLVVVGVALYSNHGRALLLTAKIYEFLRAVILFFFVGLMVVMGREWEKMEFGIAFGFGIDVAVSLLSVAIWARVYQENPLLNRLPVIVYDIACIVWLYCVLTAEKTASAPPISPEALHEAKKWEGTLKNLVHHGKR